METACEGMRLIWSGMPRKVLYPIAGGALFLAISIPMFIWNVELGIHNPTLYGAIYFLFNLVPILLLIESEIFYQGHVLGGLTIVQEQSIVALVCCVFWMILLVVVGTISDRVRSATTQKPDK